MQPHFVTSHYKSLIGLSLFDANSIRVWYAKFERFQAEAFVDMLLGGSNGSRLHFGNYHVEVLAHGFTRLVQIGDDSPFLLFEVELRDGEFEDLASTIQMHIIASESETRPKDELPALDDTMNQNWTPEKEKEAFGGEMDDRDDPADYWKKGK